MSKTVIKVENLSKQYRLGKIGTGSLSHDVNRWWHNVRGKEDPYLKIGETNDRTAKGSSDYVWSLRDIDFDIKQGDAVGIIGRNGAGKSTLLKILSRTTAPTTGKVKIRGRVASLLEVGTGFHPELSGRENIFLNGAILGMTKAEIKRKFDEIVDFAGVERYIDTPVKRYSSGMYVRLAFGVAAHLEPDILIVDEVLAVGDAEFQKKALGKMQDVSKGEGRTVLFVSHNMNAIRHLCSSSIVLKNGEKIFYGETEAAINDYVLESIANSDNLVSNVRYDAVDEMQAQIISVSLLNEKGSYCTLFDLYDKIFVKVEYKVNTTRSGLSMGMNIKQRDIPVFISCDTDQDPDLLNYREPGQYSTTVELPHILKGGTYFISFDFGIMKSEKFDIKNNVLSFKVVEDSIDTTFKGFSESRPGMVRVELDWELTKL